MLKIEIILLLLILLILSMNPTKPIVLILKNFNNLTIKNVNIEQPKKKDDQKKLLLLVKPMSNQ